MLSWQDIAITIGGIVLTLALLPLVYKKETKVPLMGSLPTAAVLFPTYMFIFFTLNLWLSGTVIGIEGLLWWFVVFFRRLKETKGTSKLEAT